MVSVEDALLLAEQIGALYGEVESCDVVFLVGKHESRVHAHAAVIAARSAVFKAMLYGPMRERSREIKIPNIEKEAFDILLKYIYSSIVEGLSQETVVDVLAASNQYQVLPLTSSCIDFIQNTLSSVNVCRYLIDTRSSYPEIYELCMQYVEVHSEEVFLGEGYLDLPETTLVDILRRDFLCILEIKLFKSVLKWGERQCDQLYRSNLSLSSANTGEAAAGESHLRISTVKFDVNDPPIPLHEVVSRVVEFIRLPLMSVSELREVVKPENVVSTERYVAALEFLASNRSFQTPGIDASFFRSRYVERNSSKLFRFSWDSSGPEASSYTFEDNNLVALKSSFDSEWKGAACFGDSPIFFPTSTNARRRAQGSLEYHVMQFEVEVVAMNSDASGVIIGVGRRADGDSYTSCFGYGGNGISYPSQSKIAVIGGSEESVIIQKGDAVGVKVDTLKRQVSFYKNGELVFINNKYPPVGAELLPVVFLHYRGDIVRIRLRHH